MAMPKMFDGTKIKQDILGHSITGILRWMVLNKWRSDEIMKILHHYKITISPTALQMTRDYPNQGRIAPVTKAQEKVLAAIRDDTPIPEIPKEVSLTDKLEALVQSVTTHYKFVATNPSLLTAVNDTEPARVKVEAFLDLVTSLQNDLQECLKTTGEYLNERIRKGE